MTRWRAVARLFIHAGLHKTGSTSLQHLLEANRDSLPPDVRFVSRHSPAFQRLTAVCRAYDPKARERSAAQVSDAMSSLLDGLAPGPADRLLLSAEDFAGAMPSTRQARPLYDTAPAIAAALLGGAAGHEVSFVYYARARLAWLESWHKHQILWRANPLPWKDLMQRPQVAAFDPVSVVEAVCHAVPAPVISLMLEDDLAVPGPGAGFLRAAGLDAAQIAALRPVPPQQQAPRGWVFALIRARAFARLPAAARRWLKKRAVRLDRGLRLRR